MRLEYEWTGREVQWDRDSELMRDLFEITWKKHPICNKPFFDWNLLDNHRGRAIAFCAEPNDRHDILAGVYLVIPTSLLKDGQNLKFSTSMYTVTHPAYYKKGVFKGLAEMTFEKCFEMGILGAIGVPNNNSLWGLTKRVGFAVLGQLEVMARVASPFLLHGQKIKIREIRSEGELKDIDFSLDRRKSLSGIIMGERSEDFIRWRFFHCPGSPYRVFIAMGEENSVDGLMVMRTTRRLGMPLTVIIDLIVDHTCKDARFIAKSLLTQANYYAWKALTPFIVTLVNPFSYEAHVLRENGYKKVPKKILPHANNFCLKLSGKEPRELTECLSYFKNWYFSFADFDIV